MMKRVFFCLVLSIYLTGCTSSRDLKDLSEWRIKADKAYQDGQYQDALKYYDKLSDAVPAEAELWFRLGNTYARMSMTDEAIKAYREAMVRDPYFSKAWYNAALNQLRASSNTFLESLNYIPKNDPVYILSESYYQKLFVLMDEQNAALTAMTTKPVNPSINVNAVEMIVLDGKAGGLSEDLSHEDLLEVLVEPEFAADQAAQAPSKAPVKSAGHAEATPQDVVNLESTPASSDAPETPPMPAPVGEGKDAPLVHP
jgi:tetratricopeptide (TPR) repeat protein